MPETALNHFRDDLQRARAILEHASSMSSSTDDAARLRSDLFRSSWMFAVGALDAYFCDAYTDIVATTIISKSRQDSVVLPDFFYEIKFPVRAILEPYQNNINWRWRMAARKMMERETVLKLTTIQTLFNKFFRRGHRFFGDVIESWILHPDGKKRLFGTTPRQFAVLTGADRNLARTIAIQQMEERFREIFQRRHDCIHNCDRPRQAPQSLNRSGTVLKVIQDIEFLVPLCDAHIRDEFREFLLEAGFSATTVAQAGY